MKALDLPSGTVYPLLTRMTKAGWLNRELEDIDPRKEGRPAKRFYQLSEVGLTEGKKLVDRQALPLMVTDDLKGAFQLEVQPKTS